MSEKQATVELLDCLSCKTSQPINQLLDKIENITPYLIFVCLCSFTRSSVSCCSLVVNVVGGGLVQALITLNVVLDT